MVKVCSYNYSKSDEEEYKKYYANYPYELHDFQKWSIEATVTGNHVLICCPTGSGKTFGGEFAINYFHSKVRLKVQNEYKYLVFLQLDNQQILYSYREFVPMMHM
jgi:superfamily II DNA or RNA helicase